MTRAFLSLILLAMAAPAEAQETEVPYWASIRTDEVNMRVGPGSSYRIDWVYRRPMLPLKVVRRVEGWRLVEDPDGARGWILARFLSRERSVMVAGKGLADMRRKPSASAPLLWRLEPGVVARLHGCEAGWCEIELKGRRGYARQARLWGAGEP